MILLGNLPNCYPLNHLFHFCKPTCVCVIYKYTHHNFLKRFLESIYSNLCMCVNFLMIYIQCNLSVVWNIVVYDFKFSISVFIVGDFYMCLNQYIFKYVQVKFLKNWAYNSGGHARIIMLASYHFRLSTANHYMKLKLGTLVSFCPSLRLWTESCPLCILYNTRRIHFLFTHLIKQLQRVCHM